MHFRVAPAESGVVPDREGLLARYPELADRLRDFFADYDRLDRQAGELRLSGAPGRAVRPEPMLSLRVRGGLRMTVHPAAA